MIESIKIEICGLTEIISDVRDAKDLPDFYSFPTQHLPEDFPIKEFAGKEMKSGLDIKILRETSDVVTERIGENRYAHRFTENFFKKTGLQSSLCPYTQSRYSVTPPDNSCIDTFKN